MDDDDFMRQDVKFIGRSCNELQSNLIMINHYVAFYHKIPNKNFMSIVKMKYMYVYGSYPNPSLVFMTRKNCGSAAVLLSGVSPFIP